jgi:pimeloyl-ACP methyl ester carboxylesterase
MFVRVNGIKLFVEVIGAKLEPAGATMAERPTVVALHGGPSDHAHMREMTARIPDYAQLILYDHRGCGRSEHGDPALWTMPQWGDDVRGLIDALGIERPIVIGASFGGYVAQSYATRHPGHSAKLGLIVTGTRENFDWSVDGFRKQGGETAADAAREFLERPSKDSVAKFMTHCRHLYTTGRTVDAELAARTKLNPALLIKFFKDFNSYDFRSALTAVTGPVLVLGGEDDPILPPPFQDELAACLVNAQVTRKSFANAGHFLHTDAGDAYFGALRDFILSGDR